MTTKHKQKPTTQEEINMSSMAVSGAPPSPKEISIEGLWLEDAEGEGEHVRVLVRVIVLVGVQLDDTTSEIDFVDDSSVSKVDFVGVIIWDALQVLPSELGVGVLVSGNETEEDKEGDCDSITSSILS
eukprot:gb/GEZN01015129.1/.p2 GENE.gb/GEZN01015129.1/~~gb/GEZN01015129.1/.p2  ORF type:complete len:128 (+),score=14.94 gb/GEZN01015129.1/:345-728(+)